MTRRGTIQDLPDGLYYLKTLPDGSQNMISVRSTLGGSEVLSRTWRGWLGSTGACPTMRTSPVEIRASIAPTTRARMRMVARVTVDVWH